MPIVNNTINKSLAQGKDNKNRKPLHIYITCFQITADILYPPFFNDIGLNC